MANTKVDELFGDAGQEQNDYLSLRESFPYRPTLFLGLGGTGCQAVAKIKRMFRETYVATAQVKGDGNDAGIPSMYSFRGFDTDETGRLEELEPEREWFHLGVGDLAKFYKTNKDDSLFRPWIAHGMGMNAVRVGAGGFRNVGKLALFAQFDVFAEAVETAYADTIRGDAWLRNPNPIIYVICSVSGGSGSGMLLDACFYLKAQFPDAKIVGLIAVFDGLPTLNHTVREKMRRGTYCGLRELDAFMSGRATGCPEGREYDLPYGRKGLYGEPFNVCYLIHSHDDSNQVSLPTQAHVTSFIARSIFMMAAYAFDTGTTPDYDGTMVNNVMRLTEGPIRGAYPRYIVPAMGQMHFPIDQCADLFLYDATIRFIEYVGGGNTQEDATLAQDFIAGQGLRFQEVREAVSIHPETGNKLPAKTYDDDIASYMSEDGETRYKMKKELLAIAGSFPDGRLQQYESVLSTNVEALLAHAVPGLDEEVGRILCDPSGRALGAIDFLTKLAGGLRAELDELAGQDAHKVAPNFELIESQWSQIGTLVNDVMTDDGRWDRIKDGFQLGKARELLIAFLNTSDMRVLDRARNTATNSALQAVIDHVEGLRDRLRSTFVDVLPGSARVLSDRRKGTVNALAKQERGQAASLQNVRSVSVLSQEWREGYFAKSEHYRPRAIMQTLLSRGWHPMHLLEESPAEGSNFAKHLAKTLAGRILPMTAGDRRLTPMQVVMENHQERGRTPEEVIGARIANILKAQMPITTGHTNMRAADFSKIVFVGGINEEMAELLHGTESLRGVKELIRAESWENNRFTFFSAHLPITMAGCERLETYLASSYDRWVKDLGSTAEGKKKLPGEIRKFLCFPGSDAWPCPARYDIAVGNDARLFAMVLALSEMLPPTDADGDRMRLAGKGPKDRLYGMFQIGSQHFWLWPYFEPRGKNAIPSGLVKLGTNVMSAFDDFCQSEDHLKAAEAWVQWWEENWSTHLNKVEVEAAANKAIATFTRRQAKVTDPAQNVLWEQFKQAVQKWRDEL